MKAVRLYLAAARVRGVEPAHGLAALDDELVDAVVAATQPGTGRPRGEGWAVCEAHREFIAGHLDHGVRLTKVGKVLRRRGVEIGYDSSAATRASSSASPRPSSSMTPRRSCCQWGAIMFGAIHRRSLHAVVRPSCLAVAGLVCGLQLACGQVESEVPQSRDPITYGEPDAGRHPNVGSLMLLFEDGVYRSSCSGVLIAPRVFVTAGHCVAWFWEWAPKGSYGVSFLDNVRPNAAPGLVPAFGQAILHPGFASRGGNAIENDYAVIVLDEPAAPTPAELPALGALDALAERNGLNKQTFTVVGYGVTEDFVGAGIRRVTTGSSARSSRPSCSSPRTRRPATAAAAAATRAARTSWATVSSSRHSRHGATTSVGRSP